MSRTLRVSVRNAKFQQWETLLRNRTKRHRAGSFLVQGVRPISLAVEHGWTIEALLYDADRGRLSDWARGLLERPHILKSRRRRAAARIASGQDEQTARAIRRHL